MKTGTAKNKKIWLHRHPEPEVLRMWYKLPVIIRTLLAPLILVTSIACYSAIAIPGYFVYLVIFLPIRGIVTGYFPDDFE